MPVWKSYTTRRLLLRPLALRDHSAWCDALDSALPKQNKFDFDASRAALRLKKKFREAVAKHKREAKTDSSYVYNIFHRRTGELIGWLDLSTIQRDSRQMANLGYFIFNNQRGKGFGKEALKRIVRAGFEDLGYHRLEAATDLDNKASIALAKAAGLHYEGVKKHYWFQNDRWEDQRIFVALPELFRG